MVYCPAYSSWLANGERAALPNSDPGDERFGGDPPPEESASDIEIAVFSAHFARARSRGDRVDIAQDIDDGIEGFQKVWRSARLRLHLDTEQRDGLLEGLAGARLAVEIYLGGIERDRIVDAIVALQALAVHYGAEPGRRRLPSDRLADLVDHMRLGQNAARDIMLLARIEANLIKRRFPTLEFCVKQA